MKGILLAGGSGTRLYPITHAVSKQLLSVYDKPMVYYPLSNMMWAGIREVLLISTETDIGSYRRLMGDGSQWGVKIEYAVQAHPRGLAEAFIIGAGFVGNDSCSLFLGDNILYGEGLPKILQGAAKRSSGASVFAYRVSNPSDFGVVEFNQERKAISLEEKPQSPKSRFAVPGIYFYDDSVVSRAKKVKPSVRGELEITSINQMFLQEGALNVEVLGRGIAWLDAGTPQSLLDACNFIASIQTRQGLQVACPEEVAYRCGFIDRARLAKIAEGLGKTMYGRYLQEVLNSGT